MVSYARGYVPCCHLLRRGGHGGFHSHRERGCGSGNAHGYGVYQIAVPVFVIVNMGMFMGVLQADGVFHHQNSCNNHDGEPRIELDTRALIQQQDTEDHTQKGSDGVISTGLGGTQILLGFDVKTGWPIFLCLRWGSKARPEQSEGIKQFGGLFCRAWENPTDFRRIPEECGWNLHTSDAEKHCYGRNFEKSHKKTHIVCERRNHLIFPMT